jgi:O-antigen/teichoic acid export membrane protein
MSLAASVAFVGLRGLAGVFSIATMAVFARSLGPSGYAEFALAVAAALLVSAVSLGPLHSALVRFYHDRSHDRTVLVNFFHRVALGIVALGVCVGAAWTQHAALILAAASLAITQGAFDYAVQDATAAQSARAVGRLYVVKSTVGICAALIVWWLGATASAAVASLAVANAVAIAVFGRQPFSFPWTSMASLPREYVREIGAFAAPLAVVSVLVFCAQWADRTVVGVQMGAHTLGAYVAVSNLTQQIIGMLFGGIAAAWYPRLVEAFSRSDEAEVRRLFGRYVELLAVLVVPAVIGFAAIAPQVAHLMFGADFRIESALWIPLLALGAGLAGLKSHLLDLPLFLTKRTAVHACIVAAAAATSLLASMVLVPQLGASGGAAAYAAATLAGCAASFIAGRGTARMSPSRRTFAGVAMGCTAMLVPTLATLGDGVVDVTVAVALGFVTYVVVLWVMDVSDVRTALRRAIEVVRRRDLRAD